LPNIKAAEKWARQSEKRTTRTKTRRRVSRAPTRKPSFPETSEAPSVESASTAPPQRGSFIRTRLRARSPLSQISCESRTARKDGEENLRSAQARLRERRQEGLEKSVVTDSTLTASRVARSARAAGNTRSGWPRAAPPPAAFQHDPESPSSFIFATGNGAGPNTSTNGSGSSNAAYARAASTHRARERPNTPRYTSRTYGG